jgi:hypothetical protein
MVLSNIRIASQTRNDALSLGFTSLRACEAIQKITTKSIPRHSELVSESPVAVEIADQVRNDGVGINSIIRSPLNTYLPLKGSFSNNIFGEIVFTEDKQVA